MVTSFLHTSLVLVNHRDEVPVYSENVLAFVPRSVKNLDRNGLYHYDPRCPNSTDAHGVFQQFFIHLKGG